VVVVMVVVRRGLDAAVLVPLSESAAIALAIAASASAVGGDTV